MMQLAAKVWRSLHLPKLVQLFFMRRFQDQFLIGTTGIIFDAANRILLVKHTYRPGWSLPGGYSKAKEHPTEGIAREILEETGFTVAIDSELKIRTDRDSARLDICYVGTYIGGTLKPSGEIKQAQFFTFDQLPLLGNKTLFLVNEALQQRQQPLAQ